MIWPGSNSPRPDESGGQTAVTSAVPTGRLFWILLAALYLVCGGLAARLLAELESGSLLPWYIGLFLVYFVLFSLLWFRPGLPVLYLHLVFVVQCLIVLALLLLDPQFDYLASFFVPLAYQAAVLFSGRARRWWVTALLTLIGVSLIITGGLRGLGLALTPMAVALALAALASASQEMESARNDSQQLVRELEGSHRQLERYAAEVEGLAALEERNRLMSEVYDSVSQAMFAILLATRSAQMMQEKDAASAHGELERLQALTQDALARMRDFIAELRQKPE